MEQLKKIFVLGGAGFLGYHTAKEAVNRGYAVKTVDIVELPENLKFKEEDKVEFIIKDFFNLSDQEIISLLKDCDGFVYAGGVDERIVPSLANTKICETCKSSWCQKFCSLWIVYSAIC